MNERRDLSDQSRPYYGQLSGGSGDLGTVEGMRQAAKPAVTRARGARMQRRRGVSSRWLALSRRALAWRRP